MGWERRIERWLRRTERALAPFERFVREYTAGLRTRDLQHLFDRDAPEAWAVLTRDQEDDTAAPRQRGWRRALQLARMVFLGLSYKLSPPRRVLFAVAMLCILLGIVTCNVQPDIRTGIDDSPFWFLLGAGGLLFLLALELVERIRFRDELQVARQLQHDLLPHSAPDVAGWSFAFSYSTANEVGGDFYDFIPLADGRLAVIAGDASGHGMSAGLIMATTKAALQVAIRVDPDPEHVVTRVNEVLYTTGDRRSFMTLFYGVLDPASGALECVDAAHPFPLVRHTDGTVEEIGHGAFPLGIRPTVQLASAFTTLAPGETLLLYSDGLPEAYAPERGSFGFARIVDLLASGGSPQAVHDRLISALEGFLLDHPRSDDVSLVVLQRAPVPPPPPPAPTRSG